MYPNVKSHVQIFFTCIIFISVTQNNRMACLLLYDGVQGPSLGAAIYMGK